MSLQAFLQNLLSSRTPLQLIFIASTFTTVAFLAVRSFTKRPNDGIPLYTLQGDYKKRWSYDNPHALREAYSRVSLRLWVFRWALERD
jgi:hypothetical protein